MFNFFVLFTFAVQSHVSPKHTQAFYTKLMLVICVSIWENAFKRTVGYVKTIQYRYYTYLVTTDNEWNATYKGDVMPLLLDTIES